MHTRTLFVILPYAHAGMLEAEELERTLKLMLHRRQVQFTSRSYWDDGEYETEYGVRLDIRTARPTDESDPDFNLLVGEIVMVTSQLYGSIRIQLG